MSYYDYTVTKQDGTQTKLDQYKGKVLLIVNTATGCGFTPQYKDLERIYREYHDQGFEILDFPCNQFMGQAPGSDDEINNFCTLKYNTTFPRFKKIDVDGDHAEPLFRDLSLEAPFKGFTGAKAAFLRPFSNENAKQFGDKAYIRWNFTKFLIDRNGKLVKRFEPTEDMKNVEAAIKEQL